VAFVAAAAVAALSFFLTAAAATRLPNPLPRKAGVPTSRGEGQNIHFKLHDAIHRSTDSPENVDILDGILDHFLRMLDQYFA
jgi:hypothetical protein